MSQKYMCDMCHEVIPPEELKHTSHSNGPQTVLEFDYNDGEFVFHLEPVVAAGAVLHVCKTCLGEAFREAAGEL